MSVFAKVRSRPGERWPQRFVALLVVLCAATYIVQMSALRYRPAPEASPAAAAQAPSAPPQDLRAWQGRTSGIAFSEADGEWIAALPPRKPGPAGVAVLHAAFAVPDGMDALRLRFRVGADSLVAGERAWQAGRVQIVSFDGEGRRIWYWPHEVFSVSGDRPLGPVSAIVPLGPQIQAALIVVYNGAEAGVLRLGPLGVEPLVERPLFAGLRYALVLAWALAGLWAAWQVLQRAAHRASAAALLAAVALALAAALTPQPGFRTVTAPLQVWAVSMADLVLRPVPARPVPARPDQAAPGHGAEVPSDRPSASPSAPADAEARLVLPPPRRDYVLDFKHGSHFAMFFLIGLAGFLAFPGAPWLGRLACLLCLAAATECLQWFVVTRSTQLSDLAADAAGLGLAGGLVFVAGRARGLARGLIGRKAQALPGRDNIRPGPDAGA